MGLFGGAPKIHGIRELLGLLAALLEEAHTLARYGARSYTASEARSLEAIVSSLLALLGEVEERVRSALRDREA